MSVHDFMVQSNAIEGIFRHPSERETEAHREFLARTSITVEALQDFVSAVAPGAKLREERGMDVRVGDHRPPRGGPDVRESLALLLEDCNRGRVHPWNAHVEYETLHPFMDGNGRSGRALWLWMVRQSNGTMPPLSFLQVFYYQTLSASRSR